MKCTILGIGSGMPRPETNHAAIVFQTLEGNFLADCGEGTAKQLLRHGFNKDFLDAILITHYHPDHVAGLFMVMQMFYLEGRTKPLDLFLPERPAAFLDAMHMFYTFEQRFGFQLKIRDMAEAELFHSNISTLLNDHLLGYDEFIQKQQYPNMMQSYSVIIREKTKSIAYTSDCHILSTLVPDLKKTDLIIMDGMHPEAEAILDFKNDYQNMVLLIHGLSEPLSAWLEDNTADGMELAAENKTYEI
ncbi:MAG: MBL fold metallo-hydrolase [Candidatus Cloacimonadaceae bacterium]|nr:ribonuclease Z [Candidatus Cloacimonadota bacterium]HQL15364.1 ribonuclease Z [Candidatus Cloacimonadota bacterium]